jgi:NADH-quinone oxidoreductase subunit M
LVYAFIAGDKLASKVALFFGLAAAGASILLLNHYNLGEISSLTSGSQPNISFALKADGLSMAMLFIDHSFDSIIIFSLLE